MACSEAGPSVARTTAEMLSEIKSGTAAEVVMAVRYTTAPPGPTFVPALDQLLGDARPHVGGSSFQRGDLVELIGSSGSGKTTLFNFLLITTLLPSSISILLPPPNAQHVSVPLGGKGTHASLLHPVSHRSPIPRITKGMRAHIKSCVLNALRDNLRPRSITPDLARTIDEAVSTALRRVNVVKVKPRWKHWLLGLRTILSPPSLHLDPGSWTDEKDHPMDLVICDGFADGFWPERWIEEERGTRKNAVGSVRSAEDVGVREVIEVIGRIRKELGAVVVLSLQGFWGNPSTPFFVPHLPPPYPAPYAPARSNPPNENPVIPATDSTPWPLNVQITLLGRVRPLQFPADTTLVDALRSMQVEEGSETGQRFEGIVRVPGGKGLAGTLGGARVSFGIGQDGMEIWEDDERK